MADAKVSTFATKPADTCTFTYAYVAANGAYGKVAINASGGLPVYTATALTPYADNTSAIGTTSLHWTNLVMTATGTVTFHGGGKTNTHQYLSGTGPQSTDGTTTFKHTHNVQSLTADRTVTWQDQDGTVAFFDSLVVDPDYTVAVNAGSLDVTIGDQLNTLVVYLTPAAGIGSYTVTLHDGSFGGQVIHITSSKAITVFTLAGTTPLLTTIALPTTVVAPGLVCSMIWDSVTPGWVRYV